MIRRNISLDLEQSLLDNESFIYYNLIKFEKPQVSEADGATPNLASDYTYVTDAPFNVPWDDGMYESDEVTPHGVQHYIANKLLGVGGVQEAIQAKASSMTLKLSTVALGATTVASGQMQATYYDSYVDLAEAGFRQGDTINLVSPNNDTNVRIDSFTSEGPGAISNSRVYFTALDTVNNDGAPYEYTITLSSKELTALISNKEATNYSAYINRNVFIYRVHADPGTGEIIGEPFLLFKGIVSKGSIQEKAEKDSYMIWNLTSHWGDFVRVQGRQTSDSSHRAVSITGRSDRQALIKREYGSDYGFMWAERSINTLANYQSQELRYKTKKKSGWKGWFGATKLVEYYETVNRDVDLRFDMSAKYIPVVYGVQKVSGIPVFADVENNNPSNVHAVYALCEGEIAGIYDIYVEDETSVCLDEPDYDLREYGNKQEGTNDDGSTVVEDNINVFCYGRADRGDVLEGSVNNTGVREDPPYYADYYEEHFDQKDGVYYGPPAYEPIYNDYPVSESSSNLGIIHEQTYSMERPTPVDYTFHSGKPDQEADNTLVSIANSKNFKIQAQYYEGDPANYWSTSHRLLDTAYVSARYVLGEGEETVPESEYIVKGKFIECYNYDHSFKHDPRETESAGNFELGDIVNIQVDTGSGYVTQHAAVQIIDKWRIYDKEGNEDWRFRWMTNWPETGDSLVNLDGGKEVRMVHTVGAAPWTMYTHDYAITSGGLGDLPLCDVQSHSYSNSGGNGLLQITLDSDSTGYAELVSILTSAPDDSIYLSFTGFPDHHFLASSISGAVVTMVSNTSAQLLMDTLDTQTRDIVVFPSNVAQGSTTGITTNKDALYVYRTVNGAVQSRKKDIVAVSGGYFITRLPFDSELTPSIEVGADEASWSNTTVADTFEAGPVNDERVTINPAMQLLDYITSRRYGRDLDINDDLNLASFLESARLCDDKSKVTVVTAATAPLIGQVFEYRTGGRLIFQGTVSAIDSHTYQGSTYSTVQFDDPIGKLGYKWNSYREFTSGDIVWKDGLTKIAPSNGTMAESTFDGLGTVNSITLTPVDTGTSFAVNTQLLGGIISANPIVKEWSEQDKAFSSPGYTLHDSDLVKYWKYIGWDEPEQRYVTRHQLNQVIDTSTSIFDNINGMLIQFNGILRYSNGKYDLDIKTAAAPEGNQYWEDGVTELYEEDIHGDIKLDDSGQKQSYNSIAASIVDPHNKFNTTSISFFNSDYLKQDKGVIKQGNASLPGISNYYTARTNIVQLLDESRYGLTISFTTDPKGYLLLAGRLISMNYSRFGWTRKLFRLQTITLQPDGMVAIVATEHNDSAYLIDYSDRSGDGLGIGYKDPSAVQSPTNLVASQDLRGEIELTWTNSAQYTPLMFLVEIWGAEAIRESVDGKYVQNPAESGIYTGNDFIRAKLIDQTVGDSFVHTGLGDGHEDDPADAKHVWFYWIRYILPPYWGRTRPIISRFEPLSNDDGVEGRALDQSLLDAVYIVLSNESHTFSADSLGNVLNYTGSGTRISLYEGSDLVEYDPAFNGTDKGKWNFTGVETNILQGTPATVAPDGFSALVPDHNSFAVDQDTASISYLIDGRRYKGETIQDIQRDQTFSKASTGTDGDQGAAGIDSKTVKLISPFYVIVYDENEVNPNPSGDLILQATPQNIVGTPMYKFTGDGFADQGSFSSSDSLTWPVPANFFNTPKTIRVDVADSDSDPQASVAFDNISITAVHPGQDGSEGVDARGVSLSAATLGVVYDTEGLGPDPTSIVITATPYNYTGTPTFQFLVNDVEVQAGSTNAIYTYYPPNDRHDMDGVAGEGGTGNAKIEVKMEDGPWTDTPQASDQITIYPLVLGSDAISVILSNEAHTVPAAPDGTVDSGDYIGTGTRIQVYEGALPIYWSDTPGARTFDVSIIDDTNITADLSPTPDPGDPKYYIDYGPHSDFLQADNYAAITYEISGQTFEGKSFNVEKVQSFSKSIAGADGLNGTVGTTARAVNLSVTTDATYTEATQVFTYDGGESNPVPAAVLVLATPFNTSGSLWYEYFINGVSQGVPTEAADTFVYNAPASFTDMPQVVNVEVREDGPTGGVVAVDQTTMSGLLPGSNAITISMPNSSHVVSCLSDGTPNTLAGSGTIIRVWEGTSELDYDSTGTTPSTYNVTHVVSPLGAVAPSLSKQGSSPGYAVVADYTSMTEDDVSVTFTIYGKRASGIDFTFDLQQTLAKSRYGVDGAEGGTGAAGIDARSVVLTATDLTVEYKDDRNGNFINPEPSGITITAEAFNWEDDPYYAFHLNNSSTPEQNTKPEPPGTPATYNYTPDPNLNNMPETVEVVLREGGAAGTILARDQIDIIGLKQGGDALNVVLTNVSHTLPADPDGEVTSFANSGTDIDAWEGATQLDYNPTLSVNSTWRINGTPAVSGGVTAYPGATIGAKTYSSDNLGAFDSAFAYGAITFTAEVKDRNGNIITFSPVQTFSKSTDGSDGTIGSDGYDGIYVIIGNEAHVVSCDEAGDPYTSPHPGSGTKIRVFEGNTELQHVSSLSGAGQFVISATPTDIVTGTITTTGLYATVGDHSGFTDGLVVTDAEIVYTVSYRRTDNTSGSVDRSQTFSKSIKGDFGQDGKLVRIEVDFQAVQYNELGNRITPASVNFTADAQGYDVPYYYFTGPGWSSGPSTTPTAAVSTPTTHFTTPRTYQVQVKEGVGGTYDTSDKVTIYGVKEGDTGADGEDGLPGTPGADGDDGSTLVEVTAYQRAASQPSVPTGDSYNFGTSVLTVSAPWYNYAPASNGNPCWVSHTTFKSAAGGGGITYTPEKSWSTPRKLVEDGESGGDAPLWMYFRFNISSPRAPTDLEVNTLVDRDPISGDIAVVTAYGATPDEIGGYRHNGSSWSATDLVAGDLIVDGSIAGTALSIHSTSGSERIEINSDNISIYDSSTLRIKLGNLA